MFLPVFACFRLFFACFSQKLAPASKNSTNWLVRLAHFCNSGKQSVWLSSHFWSLISISMVFFFSVYIYALSDTFDLINFKLTPFIYSSVFLILHPTFGTLQSALSLSLLYRSACFDTDSSFISFAQHQIFFICNFKMLLDINW